MDGELPETIFEAFMFSEFPLTREPTVEQLKSYHSYEEKDKEYSTKNTDENEKVAERKLLIGYTRAALAFGDKETQPMVYSLDSKNLKMTTATLSSDLNASVHIANPCTCFIVDQPECPYNRYAELGHPVAMFACTAWEYFDALGRAILEGLLKYDDGPCYALLWIDTCGKVDNKDIQTIDLAFRFDCFRRNGPSILALTFSSRQKNPYVKRKRDSTMAYGNSQVLIAHVKRLAKRYMYKVFQPSTQCVPICKKNMYTLIFCVYPKSWKSTKYTLFELHKALDMSAQGNIWCRNLDDVFQYEFWSPKRRK